MTASDLTEVDISTLSLLISRRDISPVALVEAYLSKIDRRNPALNAYISVYPEQAHEAATIAENEIAAGDWRGPLHGVPLAIKDLYQVSGMRRTCGSRLIDEPPSVEDSTSVARLRNAGAIILGMANLHEFAFGPTGVNDQFGSARNPWNPDLCCGGSSSGSACAVAGGLAAGALGTDTGGSIRIPAALCGCVGLKQSYGLASRHGIYPVSALFDHGGPITRTVGDAAIMLDAIAGADPRDPTTAAARVDDYEPELDRGVRGLRIGVPHAFFFDSLHNEVGDAVNSALTLLSDLGADVVEVGLPVDCDQVERAWDIIALADAYAVHEQHVRDGSEMLSRDVRARLLRGRDMQPVDIAEAKSVRLKVIAAMKDFMHSVDVLAMPTSPIPAVSLSDRTIEIDGESIRAATVLGRLTRFAAFTGQPAISVPCGFTGDGRPIGLQMIGDWFAESFVLRTARAYENATDWHIRRPPLDPAP